MFLIYLMVAFGSFIANVSAKYPTPQKDSKQRDSKQLDSKRRDSKHRKIFAIHADLPKLENAFSIAGSATRDMLKVAVNSNAIYVNQQRAVTLHNGVIAHCIRSKIKRWRFSKGCATEVTAPFIVSAEDHPR